MWTLFFNYWKSIFFLLKIIFFQCLDAKKLYSIFHLSGNLLKSLKHSLQNEYIKYVSNIKIEITAFNLTRKDGYDCNIGSYDHCVAQQRLLQNLNCSLPFEIGQQYEENVCQTYKEGVNVTKEILNSRKICKPSCFQTDVRY